MKNSPKMNGAQCSGGSLVIKIRKSGLVSRILNKARTIKDCFAIQQFSIKSSCAHLVIVIPTRGDDDDKVF
jgi:hypothetical protein